MSENKVQGMGQAAISSGGGLLSTLISNRAARKENDKTREYNLKLAQMQNQWNVEQWQRENAYNSPSAQLQRLQDAGINPDLIYGGGISNTSASSPQMTAGSAASPTPLVGMPNVVGDYLDAQLKQAQIDNINANTNKQGVETSILTDQKKFAAAIQQGQINLQNAQIKLIGKQGELTDQQIIESQQTCLSIEATTKQMYANIDKIRSDIDISKALSDADIKAKAAHTKLSYAQAKNIVDQLPHVIDQLKSQTANNSASANLHVEELGQLELKRDAVAFQARIESGANGYQPDLTSWQHVIMFVSEIMNTLGHAVH